jgi:hypothetical protein
MLRNIKFSGLAILTIAIAFSSCKKKDNPPPSNPTSGAKVTCVINGKTWSSKSANEKINMQDSFMYGVNATMEADTLGMTAISVDGADTSWLLISGTLNSNKLGTYTQEDVAAIYFPSFKAEDILNVFFNYTVTSSVTITKYDATKKTISGTFNITMTPTSSGTTYTINTGKFDDIPFEQL